MSERTATVVERVCRIAADSKARWDISPVGLLAESGYQVSPESITEQLIEQHLRSHSELLSSWELYSDDQRCMPTQFLDLSACVVGYLSYGPDGQIMRSEREFADEYLACARFIKNEAEILRRNSGQTN